MYFTIKCYLFTVVDKYIKIKYFTILLKLVNNNIQCEQAFQIFCHYKPPNNNLILINNI